MKPIISVVIPLYNAEKYISNCIRSVLNQIFSNFEIIIIDDGSIDKSYMICSEMLKSDPRIKLYHQENLGVSNARYNGVKKAVGEYIFFLDADDTIRDNTLDDLYKRIIDGYDIVQTGCRCDMEFNGTEFVRSLLLHESPFNIWGKLIKKELLTSIDMHINREINIGEDLILNIRLGLIAKKIYSMSNIFYNYENNPNSVTATSTKSVEYEKKFIELMYDILKNRMSEFKNEFIHFKIASLQDLILYGCHINYKDPWVEKIIYDSSCVKLSRSEILVVNIKSYFICKQLLLLERKISSIIRWILKITKLNTVF